MCRVAQEVGTPELGSHLAIWTILKLQLLLAAMQVGTCNESNLRSYCSDLCLLCGVSPTAQFSIQWCIPIGKWLSQVSKTSS